MSRVGEPLSRQRSGLPTVGEGICFPGVLFTLRVNPSKSSHFVRDFRISNAVIWVFSTQLSLKDSLLGWVCPALEVQMELSRDACGVWNDGSGLYTDVSTLSHALWFKLQIAPTNQKVLCYSLLVFCTQLYGHHSIFEGPCSSVLFSLGSFSTKAPPFPPSYPLYHGIPLSRVPYYSTGYSQHFIDIYI